jgi:hypothetical protein
MVIVKYIFSVALLRKPGDCRSSLKSFRMNGLTATANRTTMPGTYGECSKGCLTEQPFVLKDHTMKRSFCQLQISTPSSPWLNSDQTAASEKKDLD